MRKHYFASKAGMVLPLLVLCVCAFGFVFAPNDPELVDLTKKFLAPCPEFPLGADNLGRCVLSRLLYGGRTTLGIVLQDFNLYRSIHYESHFQTEQFLAGYMRKMNTPIC